MFDMLTSEELFQLHSTLFRSHQALNARIVSTDYPYPPIVSVFSDEWNLIGAFCSEISETMHAVYAEITRRDREAVNA